MSNSEVPATVDDIQNEVATSSRPVVLDFGSPTCTKCKLIDPIVDSIATDFADRVKVYRINVDENLEVARHYQVMSAPTVIIINSGEVTKRVVGYYPQVRAELLDGLGLNQVE